MGAHIARHSERLTNGDPDPTAERENERVLALLPHAAELHREQIGRRDQPICSVPAIPDRVWVRYVRVAEKRRPLRLGPVTDA